MEENNFYCKYCQNKINKGKFYQQIIIFARHGEGSQNKLQILVSFETTTLYHLTEEGKEQVKKSANEYKSKFKKEEFEIIKNKIRIFCSPLTRTQETAKIWHEILELSAEQKIEIENGLIELQVGHDWNNKDSTQYWKHIQSQGKEDPNYHPNNSESVLDVEKRIIETTEKLIRKYKGYYLILITHGMPSALALRYDGQ